MSHRRIVRIGCIKTDECITALFYYLDRQLRPESRVSVRVECGRGTVRGYLMPITLNLFIFALRYQRRLIRDILTAFTLPFKLLLEFDRRLHKNELTDNFDYLFGGISVYNDLRIPIHERC